MCNMLVVPPRFKMNLNENCKVTGLYAYLSSAASFDEKNWNERQLPLDNGDKKQRMFQKIQFHFFDREGDGPQNPRDQLRKRWCSQRNMYNFLSAPSAAFSPA